MAVKLTARRGLYYQGVMLKAGDPFEASEYDVALLTGGRNPLAERGGTAKAPAFDVEKATKEELEAEAERRGIEVKGTGKDGNVLVSDLRAALG